MLCYGTILLNFFNYIFRKYIKHATVFYLTSKYLDVGIDTYLCLDVQHINGETILLECMFCALATHAVECYVQDRSC